MGAVVAGAAIEGLNEPVLCFVDTALVEQHTGEIVIGFSEGRVEGNGFQQGRLAARQVSPAVPQGAEIALQPGVIRLPAEGLFDGRFRGGKGSISVLGDSKVEQGIGEIRLQVQRFAEVFFGFRRLPGAKQNPAKIAEGLGIAGTGLRCPPIRRQGGIRPAHGFQRRAEVVFGFREIRFPGNGVLERGTCRFMPVQRQEDQSVQVVTIRQFRLERKRPGNVLQRRWHVALLVGDDRQKIKRAGIVWIDVQGVLEPRHRRLSLPRFEGCESGLQRHGGVGFALVRHRCCSPCEGRVDSTAPVP